jgi:hypothetical protein
MSGILREHRLDPGASTMEASCNVVRYGDIGLVYKHYGVQVRIRTEPIETFRLVQIPLAGWARVLNGTADIASDPAVASVPDPDAPLGRAESWSFVEFWTGRLFARMCGGSSRLVYAATGPGCSVPIRTRRVNSRHRFLLSVSDETQSVRSGT